MPPAQHVYDTFIRATRAEVWAAITRPEFTRRYFFTTEIDTDLSPGSPYRYTMGDGLAVDGVIEEVVPEERLVMTWHVRYDPELESEPPGRVEWLLRPANDDGSVTRLTVRHHHLGSSPKTSEHVALGWVSVLDGMKTLLETGEPLGPVALEDPPTHDGAEAHRQAAARANGETWALLAAAGNGAEVDCTQLLERAYTSAYHWRLATGPEAIQQARAEWLLARCHTVAGNKVLAADHARRCAALTEACADAADFDHAYAREALARAHALAGRADEAAREREAAEATEIANPGDREIFESDLAAGPWYVLED